MTVVALVGNPNSGKTTIFNKLTGSSQRVGNWPGVTIEKKTGEIRGHHDIELVDLPGIYSLTPYSPEEVVTRDFLTKETPDAVINIVDATNLERNLYLTTQIAEMGIPIVIALNMSDIARNRGIAIDAEKLGRMLGCSVVPTCALRNEGVDRVVEETVGSVGRRPEHIRFSDATEDAIAEIERAIGGSGGISPRWYAVKLLENDSLAHAMCESKMDEVAPVIAALEEAKGDTGESVIADERYTAIADIVGKAKSAPEKEVETVTDKIDRIVTSKWLGLPIFALVLFVVYFFTIGSQYRGGDPAWYNVGYYLTEELNAFLCGAPEDVSWSVYIAAQDWLAGMGVEEGVASLLTDGIIQGVGAVLGFLPQILILFLFLSLLEDCGYMARVCFVMDRLFRRFNLSGKSFIPLLVGTGCSVPGIMATRTIENDCDRRITAMTTSFIPCSAKLPIISLFVADVFGGNAWVAVFCYFLGVLAVLTSGVILKKWRDFAGESSVFIMELPPYHTPKAANVAKTTLDRGWAFVKKAGTLILLATVIVWFLSSFDWSMSYIGANEISGSMLQDIGTSIAGLFAPLGFDEWRFTVATFTGLLAKETVVATFEVLFDGSIAEFITAPAALSFLAFNLLCAPCFAAIGAMKRELGGRMMLFGIGYQCLLAYGVASIVYFAANAWHGTFEPLNIAVAAVAVVILVALLALDDPFKAIGRGKPAGDGAE